MYHFPKRIVATFLIATAAVTTSLAGVIKGKVVDQNRAPLEFVNVSLLDANGKLVTGAIVEESGRFQLIDVKDGTYTLRLTYVGYQTLERKVTLGFAQKDHTLNLHTLTLQDDSAVLDDVTVVGQKSAMRFELDKKVFDIGSQASAVGLSASEALENIPSVEVDSEGSISLRGSTSVTVWINGKAQGLTSDNRGDILQQMPAESIDHIEVITNPSSKYSPEGSAGIINIVLKRDRKAGYYGGVQLNVNNEKGGRVGANINYSSGILEAYANLGVGRRVHNGGSYTDRDYLDAAGNKYANLITDSENENVGKNLFSRAGLTWHFTSKDEIGLNFMGMFGDDSRTTDYTYTYRELASTVNNYDRTRRSGNDGDNKMFHFGLDYRHEWKTNHTLDVQLSRNQWRSPSDTWYDQQTTMGVSDYCATGIETRQYSTYQSQQTTIQNKGWELQADYVQPIGQNNKFEAGYKGEWRREDSPTQTWNDEARQDNVITLYNRFIYNIDIHAAYLNYGGKIGKHFSYQLGLRNEYWKVHTESTNFYEEHPEYQKKSTDPEMQKVEPFDKNYNQLFPTAFLSWMINEGNELQVNYTRRMHRPWGGQMNSFQNISDSTSISYGNPELTPSYTNSFEFNYLRMWTEQTLSVSAYYRPTDDVTQNISYMENNIRYSTNVNVAKELQSGIEIVSKNKLWHTVDVTTTLNGYYHKLDGGDFTTMLNGKEYAVSVTGSEDFAWNARVQIQSMLPGKVSFQCRANYDAPRKITQGTRESSWSFDASLKRSFFDGKFTIALNGRNLFNSRKWRTTTDYMSDAGGYHQYNKSWRGNRRIILQFNYTFGNMRAKKGDRERGDQNGDDDSGNSYSGGED